MSPPRAGDEAGGADRVRSAFVRRFGRNPEVLVRAPGRLCLLGAHVDTAEGWVLPGAIDRSIWLAASRRSGPAGTLVAEDLTAESVDSDSKAEAEAEAEAELSVRSVLPPVHERQGQLLTWLDYPQGVAWVLQEEGFALPSIDVVFGGDLPRGAGVSSSAAVEVAFLLAWNALAGFELSTRELSRLAAAVEHSYVGVRSGVMDPFASLHGETDHLLLLDCRTLDHRAIPLPDEVSVVVVDSGIRRRLAASGFNQRRQESAEALALVQQDHPELETLRDIAPPELLPIVEKLPEPLDRRVRHVVEECIRVRAGAAALQRGDLQTFGRLIRRSHESSRDQFECSLPELDSMAEAAWETAGCLGARFMGGGFGGCVAALVANDAAAAVQAAMTKAAPSSDAGGSVESGFVCRFGPGATVVWTA